jgi:hypothetical protein
MAMCGEGETVEDYALCLNSLAAHLATLGEEVKETQIVENMLRTLPARFKQITIAIKTLLDVSTMGVADLTGRLKEANEAFEEPLATMQHEGRLHLTEEEWEARKVRREAENQAAGGSGGSGGRGGGGRGRGHGRKNGTGGRGPKMTDECRWCGKLGHWAQECQPKPKKEQANVACNEEASLMVARATIGQFLADEESLAAMTGGVVVAAAGGVVAAATGDVVAMATGGVVAAATGGDVAEALSAVEILEEKVYV